ncbi:MAG: hypothetical protein EA397_14510 [Deltaproteobacteria bacterium]|nr:MAG: hypothetical protein EA397_14510 [Deltaproteobacteria bacterium]
MTFAHALEIGPINGGLAILSLLLGGAVVAWSLIRLHRGDPVPLIPLAVALSAPLALVMWAVTLQFPSAMSAADTVSHYGSRMTLKGAALSRGVLTQWSGGIAAAVLSLSVLGGAVYLTVRGERPRWLVAGYASLLGLGALGIALAALGVLPMALGAVRLALYVLTFVLCVAALRNTHLRGPGTQLCAVAAIAAPMAVVGIDLVVLSELTFGHFSAIAQAPPLEKRALLDVYFSSVDTLVLSASLGFGMALGAATLSPAMLWRRERSKSVALLVLLSLVLVLGSVAWAWSTHMTKDLRHASFEESRR